jgi:hypothetical protein
MYFNYFPKHVSRIAALLLSHAWVILLGVSTNFLRSDRCRVSPDQEGALHDRSGTHLGKALELPVDVLRKCTAAQYHLFALIYPYVPRCLNDKDAVRVTREGHVTVEVDVCFEFLHTSRQRFAAEESGFVINKIGSGRLGLVIRAPHIADSGSQKRLNGSAVLQRVGLAGDLGGMCTSIVKCKAEAGHVCPCGGRDGDVTGDNGTP